MLYFFCHVYMVTTRITKQVLMVQGRNIETVVKTLELSKVWA